MNARNAVAWPAALLVALVVLKAPALLIDPQLRLFLGDSASYLYAASSDWNPADRSFTYPMLIEWLVLPFGSLEALLYWQTAAGIGTAGMLAWILRRRLDLPHAAAFAAACALALEPAQLLYERMVLAETFGLLAFTGFFAAASAYLARGNPAWLAPTALLGLAAVSLRLNYLPVVIVISIGLPLLRLLDRRRTPRMSLLAVHLLMAIVCVLGSHGPYRRYVATLFDGPPGYIGESGFMRMGLIAPLIEPEHFQRAGLPADFADRLAFDLRDPRTRPSQLWSPGGLADAVRKEGLDVDRVCRLLSRYAVEDDPFGVVRLGVGTLAGYFDADSARLRLAKDLGRDPPVYPADVVETVRERWRYELTGVAERWTPVGRLFAMGSAWLVACLFLLAPLGVANLIVHWRDPRRPQIVLGVLVAAGLVATHVLFSNIASYRYLHALPFFVFLNALPLGVAAWRRRGQRRGRRARFAEAAPAGARQGEDPSRARASAR